MKIIYELEPDPEKNNDEYELKLIQNAHAMLSALNDLDDLKRHLYKGYIYYPKENETEQDIDKYERIDINKLIDDLSEILIDSKYHDFH